MELGDDVADEFLRGILAAANDVAVDDDKWFMKNKLDIDASCKQLNDALVQKREWDKLNNISELKQQILLTLDDGSKDPWSCDEWQRYDGNNNSSKNSNSYYSKNSNDCNEKSTSPLLSHADSNKLKSVKPCTSPSVLRKSQSPPRSPSSQQLPPLFSPIKSQDGCDELLAWPIRVKNFLDDENVELYMRSRGTNRINTASSVSRATRFDKLKYIGIPPDYNISLSKKQHEDMKHIYSIVEPRYILGQRPDASQLTLESMIPPPDPLEHLKDMSRNFKEVVDEEYNAGVTALQTNLGMFPEWSNRFTAERLQREHKIKQFKGHMDDYDQGMVLQSFSVATKFNVLKDNKFQDSDASIDIHGYRDGAEHKKMRQEKLLKCRHPKCNKMFAYSSDVLRHELKTHYSDSDDGYFQRSFLKKIVLPEDWKTRSKQKKNAKTSAATR